MASGELFGGSANDFTARQFWASSRRCPEGKIFLQKSQAHRNLDNPGHSQKAK
jgi:hypothetical protein